MSPEAEEIFQEQLSQREIETSVSEGKMSESSNESLEDTNDKQDLGGQPNTLGNVDEVWEDDDCEEGLNLGKWEEGYDATSPSNTLCASVIAAISFYGKDVLVYLE